MSDRIPAVIKIGGVVSRELLPDLIKEIIKYGCDCDWGLGSPVETEEDISACIVEGYLTLSHADAPGGSFEDLENFLGSHSIPYTRHSDARYEYDAEVVEYRPETGRLAFQADQSGNKYVSYERVAELLNLIPNWKLLEGSLRDLVGPTIGPLPPFIISGEIS